MPSVQLTWKYLSMAIFYFQVSESHFLYLIWNYYVILLFQVKITFLINITCFLQKPHTIFSFFRLSILINPHQNFRSQWKFIPSVFEDWFSVAFYFYTHRSISVLHLYWKPRKKTNVLSPMVPMTSISVIIQRKLM